MTAATRASTDELHEPIANACTTASSPPTSAGATMWSTDSRSAARCATALSGLGEDADRRLVGMSSFLGCVSTPASPQRRGSELPYCSQQLTGKLVPIPDQPLR